MFKTKTAENRCRRQRGLSVRVGEYARRFRNHRRDNLKFDLSRRYCHNRPFRRYTHPNRKECRKRNAVRFVRVRHPSCDVRIRSNDRSRNPFRRILNPLYAQKLIRNRVKIDSNHTKKIERIARFFLFVSFSFDNLFFCHSPNALFEKGAINRNIWMKNKEGTIFEQRAYYCVRDLRKNRG